MAVIKRINDVKIKDFTYNLSLVLIDCTGSKKHVANMDKDVSSA
ncbi:MAG: hypothetical protein RSC38_06435 [Oscillospiraceae bacterium]